MALCSTAQFRRSGQRDDRRRRLLAEETLGTRHIGPAGRHAAEPSQPAAAYGEDVLMTHQVRLLDLVPRHPLLLAAILASGLGAVAALLWLDQWAASRAAESGLQLEALRFDNPQSLAGWLTEMVLVAAALVALVVYSVRRHRKDDYQGRYRVWIWAALCWVLLAADCATGMHRAVRELMVHWTGTPLLGDGSIWWLAPGALLLAAVGARLLADMLPDRLSTAALLGAGCCGLVALCEPWGTIPFGPPRLAALIPHAAALTAAVLLCWSMLGHARYVMLEAEGLLMRGRPQAAPGGQPAAAAGSPATSAPTNAAQGIPSGSQSAGASSRAASLLAGALGLGRGSSAAAPSSAAVSSAADDAAQSAVRRKLSKAERKALRKRLLEMRLKRQQSQHTAWGG